MRNSKFSEIIAILKAVELLSEGVRCEFLGMNNNFHTTI